jgi:hypothetical protein
MRKHSHHAIAEARLGGGMSLYPHNRLLSDITRKWVETEMRPQSVSSMIEDILDSSEAEPGDDCVAGEIREAMQNAGNWQEEGERHGWELCEDIQEQFDSRSPGGEPSEDYLTLLYKLLNLITNDLSESEAPPSDEIRFAWVRAWREEKTGYVRQVRALTLVEAEEMVDAGDPGVELAWAKEYYKQGEPFLFSEGALGDIPGVPGAGSSSALLEDLPEAYFITGEELCKRYAPQVEGWISHEWLNTHTFVNFEDPEWLLIEEEDGKSLWRSLGEDQNFDVDGADVYQWFMVEEAFARYAEDEVLVSINGSMVWGRQGAGQAIYMDGGVFTAMLRSGHLDRVPPLGLLREDLYIPGHGSLEIRLGGELYPFRVQSYGDEPFVPVNLLTEEAKAAGAQVEWKQISSEEYEPGTGRSAYSVWGFRILIPEGSDNPIWPRKLA